MDILFNHWIAICAVLLTLLIISINNKKYKFWKNFFIAILGLFSFLVMVDVIPTNSPSKDEHYMTLARTNFNEGIYFPADSLYQKISVSTQRYIQPEIKRNKECRDLIIEIGKDFDDGKPDQARIKLIRILRLNPNDPKISEQIANCDTLMKQAKEVTTQPKTAPDATIKKDNKQEARAYNSKGLRYSAMGDNEKSIENYTIAIKLYPNYYQAYRNRSIQYEILGRYDAAFEDADKAVKLKGEGPNYEQRGDVNCRLRKYSAAIEDYKKAIDRYSLVNTVQWYDGKDVTYQPTNEINVQVLNKLKCAEEQNCFCY